MKKHTFALFFVIVFTSCFSFPNDYSTQREPIVTLLEKVDVDSLYYDEGHRLYTQAVKTYSTMYDNYDINIIIDDIQHLVNGKYSGYENYFEIRRHVRLDQNFTYYSIVAQFDCMVVILFFSKDEFANGISSGFSWNFDRLYSNGEYERQLAQSRHAQEWGRFFESKYNEAILRLSLERRKIPRNKESPEFPEYGYAKLEFNISQALSKLEYYKFIKGLWYNWED